MSWNRLAWLLKRLGTLDLTYGSSNGLDNKNNATSILTLNLESVLGLLSGTEMIWNLLLVAGLDRAEDEIADNWICLTSGIKNLGSQLRETFLEITREMLFNSSSLLSAAKDLLTVHIAFSLFTTCMYPDGSLKNFNLIITSLLHLYQIIYSPKIFGPYLHCMIYSLRLFLFWLS